MLGIEKKPDMFDKMMNYPIGRLAASLVLGIGCTIWGMSIYLKGADLAKRGVETEGTVISIRTTQTKQAIHHYPTVEFKDAAGNTHQAEIVSSTTVRKGTNWPSCTWRIIRSGPISKQRRRGLLFNTLLF